MKKLKKVLFPILIIAILVFGYWFIKTQNKSTRQPDENMVQTTVAGLSIDYGKTSQTFDISSFVGKSALIATEATVKVTASGQGENAFVTAINGVAADPKKREFWELDANGTETQVGAGSYIIQNNDLIEWRLNTF